MNRMDQVMGFQQEKKVFFPVQKFTIYLIERKEEKESAYFKRFYVFNKSSRIYRGCQTDP